MSNEGTQAGPGIGITQDELSSYTNRGLAFNASNPAFSEEMRAQNQYMRDKWGNAIGKMGTLAGTTFLDGTLGTFVGIGNVITGGEDGKSQFSDLWNNPFSQAMASVNEKVEQALPNYRTQEELQNPWYVNMIPGSGGATNFWADTIMKNFGFAIGAMASGMLTGGAADYMLGGKETAKKIAGQLAKQMAISEDAALSLIKEGKVPAAQLLTELKDNATKLKNINLTSQILGSTASALGEARIQTINGSNDYYNQLINSGVDPNQAKEQSLEMGNIQFALNTGLLSLSNYAQFRDLFSGGYKSQADFFGRITGNFDKGFQAENKGFINGLRSAAKILENPIIEGSEELNQYWIEKSSKDFIDRRYVKI